MSKGAIWMGATIGGLIGGYIPSLWGAGDLSLWSLSLGTLGGILGIVVVYRLYSSS